LLKAETGAILGSKATWVVVSLDCIDGDAYASEKKVPSRRFDAACEGIVHLIGRAAVIGVSYLLHAGNWTLARDMVEFTRKLGANYTTLRPAVHTSPDAPGQVLYNRDWITHALPLLLELEQQSDVEVNPERFLQYRDWTTHGYTCCEGIKLNTTITPDGRMWVCPNRREYSNSCLGDLTKESFGEIWARHPGEWRNFKECRAMCRLHAVNQQIAEIRRPVQHGAFI
jgi:MoaA/NifB/PqqE/SkfB family radical SAM enzyme